MLISDYKYNGELSAVTCFIRQCIRHLISLSKPVLNTSSSLADVQNISKFIKYLKHSILSVFSFVL